MSDDDEGTLLDGHPIPLTQTPPIPAFPVDALPEPIAAMVHAVAEATQTDPAMAGTSALSVLAACAGGHAEIEVRSGWREILALHTATVAEPGERKSVVLGMLTRPLLDMESQLSAAWMPARLEAKARRQIADKAAEAARKAAVANPDDQALKDAAIGASVEAADIEVPSVPRLLADDITRAAVGQQLAEQKGRLAIISAEGGIFDMLASRMSGQIQFDVFLKGHCGDPIRIDRKRQAPLYVRRPALTVGLMLQPEVLRTIGAQPQFRGRGLLARFLYAMPASKVGRRKAAATPVPDDVADRYYTHITGLVSQLSQWVDDPAIVMLEPAARREIEAIEEAVESALADDGELAALKDWGAKYVGSVARLAGVIHLGEHPSDAGATRQVTADTIRKAHTLGEYFKAAAINAFMEMGIDPVTADAVYLLKRIEHLGADEVSERDMQRAAKRFQKKGELIASVHRLVDHGYLIPVGASEPTGGRPGSPRYKVVSDRRAKGTEGRP
jgi:replicative DNA helicase